MKSFPGIPSISARPLRSALALIAAWATLLTSWQVVQAAPAAWQGSLPAGHLLAGRTVVIDPGHGGFDPGSIGRQADEATINLQIALALRRWLEEAGARVLMTWSKPQDIPKTRKYRVQSRMVYINSTDADVLIDIHCNASAAVWHGPQTFYWAGAPSYHLAQSIQEELQYLTGSRRQVQRIDQYVLRHAKMPAVNVEVGFITNPAEEQKLLDPEYQRRLTWAIFLGVERWFLRAHWPQDLLEAPPPTELMRR
ncbi:MAG: N-acetylmuramoyl-L-alanine amidase [Firmicutes bacterium]|nr:N-acetylmuramoyl-L-alanine amidase [Alicyclobacillaceae bacterium]MCL6497848.1 N-acetylmuramoyl-L-alanine amidase [Bacillota bacterium]